MGAEGRSAHVDVEWVPEQGVPADVENWQRVIDSAYAGGYGRVRLVLQAEARWKVTSATTMLPAPSAPGETLTMSKSMREAVRSALRARGFPVV